MKEKDFRKYPFRSTTMIDYTEPRTKTTILCFLCEVDYDEEILTICPVDSIKYNQDKIQVNIKHCEIHDKKIIRLNK